MLLKRKNIVGALRTVTVALAALVYLLLVSGCGTMLQDLQDARIITAEQALYIQEEVADAVNEKVGDAAWEGWLPIAGIIGLGGLWGTRQKPKGS